MNDEWRTPPHLVGQCVDQIRGYIEGKKLLDPCSGQGVWLQYLFDHSPNVESNEILLGSDFYQNHEDYDWIIGNPPFSDLTKWLEHSALLAKEGIAYILPAYALNFKRIRMMEGFGFNLSQIHVFENPKEWRLGYPHFFVVWRQLEHAVRMKSIGAPQGLQTRLEGFE